MGVFSLLLRNISFLSVSIVVNIITTMLFAVISARYLGPSCLGIFIYASSFVFIWGYLVDFGMDKVAIRDVAKDSGKFHKYAANISSIRLFLSIVAFIIVNFAFLLIRPNALLSERVLVLILSVNFLLRSIPMGVVWCFQAFNVMKLEALQRIVESLANLGSCILVVAFNWGVLGFGWATLATSLVTAITIFFFVNRYMGFRIRLEFDFGFWKTFLIASIPFVFLYFAPVVYLNLDKILLGSMVDSENVGIFGAANKLVVALKYVPTIYIVAIFPLFSKFSSDSVIFEKLLSRTFYYLIAFTLPICVGTTLLSFRIIKFFYGNQYVYSGQVLAVAIWAFFFATLNGPLAQALISKGKQRICVFSTYLGLVVNIILNLLLIPRLGYLAPAVSIVISELFVLLPILFSIIRILNFRPSFNKLFRLCMPAIFMGVVVIVMYNMNLFVNIVISAISFILLLFLFGGIPPEDWIFLRSEFVFALRKSVREDAV